MSLSSCSLRIRTRKRRIKPTRPAAMSRLLKFIPRLRRITIGTMSISLILIDSPEKRYQAKICGAMWPKNRVFPVSEARSDKTWFFQGSQRMIQNAPKIRSFQQFVVVLPAAAWTFRENSKPETEFLRQGRFQTEFGNEEKSINQI